jgi:hypothetical protein
VFLFLKSLNHLFYFRDEQKNREIEKIGKKKLKKPNRKKKPIKLMKILKKPASSVRFRFYKPKTEKTEPNPNRKKPNRTSKKSSQIEPKPDKK